MFLLHYIRNWFLDFFPSNLNKQSLIMFAFCRFAKGWMSFGRKKALETCDKVRSTFVWMIALICLWNYSQTISFSLRVCVPIGDWFQYFVCIWLTSVELGFKKPSGPFLSRVCSLVDMQMSIKKTTITPSCHITMKRIICFMRAPHDMLPSCFYSAKSLRLSMLTYIDFVW